MNASLRRLLLYVLMYGLVCPPWVCAAPVTADPAAQADKRPSVDAAPNHVPLVNIARPNQAGLSHNQYTDFNVPREGLILNNSPREGVSRLGGVVYGNPHFQPGDAGASAILNEVTSSNRSRLDGYTEVFGRSADVILANPNGITVNGGGFINVPRATLTTGVPQVENGQLRAFAVDKGDIRIEGAGVNASNMDAFTLYSRTASLAADIHARNLTIVTGRNRVDAATGEAVLLPVTETASPAVALDSSLVGGMYAGRIALMSTEKGVGVNLQGSIQSTGDLTLTADGKLTLREAAAGQDMTLAAHDVDLTERTAAQRHLTITAEEHATVRGSVLAGGHVDVRARDVSLRQAQVAAGVDGTAVSRPGDARLTASRTLTADASRVLAGRSAAVSADDARFTNTTMASGAALAIRGATLTFTGAALKAGDALDISAATRLQADGGQWTAAGGMTLRAGELSAQALAVSAAGSLALRAGGASVLRDSRLASGGAFGFTGQSFGMTRTTLLAVGDLALTGTSITGIGLEATAGGNAALNAAALTLADSTLGAVGQLALSSQDAELAGTSLAADGLVNIVAARHMALDRITLNAGRNLTLRGAGIAMTSSAATAGGDTALTADALTLRDDRLQTDGSLALTGGGLQVTGGSLLALGDLALSGTSITGRDIKLKAGGNADVRSATDLSLTNASLSAVGDLTATAQNAQLTGSALLANHTLSLAAVHDLTLTGSLTNAGGGVSLSAAGGLRLDDSTLKTGGDLRMDAAAVTLRDGSLGAGGALALSGTALDFTRVALLSMGDLALTGTSLAGQDFRLTSGHDATLKTAERLSLTRASLGAVGNLTARAQNADVAGSSLAANANLSLDMPDGLTLTGSALNAGRSMTLTTADALGLSGNALNAGNGIHLRAAATTLHNDQLRAGGDLTLSGGHVGLTGASLLAVRNLALTGDGITGAGVALTAGGNTSLDASSRLELENSNLGTVGDLHLEAADALLSGNTLLAGEGMTLASAQALTLNTNTLNAGSDLALSGQAVGLASDTLKTGGSTTVTGDALTLQGGELAVAGDLTLTGGALTLGGGTLSAGRDMALAGPLTSTSAVLNAGRNLALTGGGALRLEGGTFSARGDLTLSYASIATNGGLLAAGRDLSLTADNLTNTGGALYASRDARYAIGGMLWNNGGELYAGRHMTIAGPAGDASRAGQLLNQSGTVAADGNMLVRAVTVTNEKQSFTCQTGNVVARYQQNLPREVLSGQLFRDVEDTVTVFEDRLLQDSPAASLRVGHNLSIDSDALINRYSFIAAGGNAVLTAVNLTNQGVELRQTTRHSIRYHYDYHEHGDDSWWYADGPVTEEHIRIGLAPAAITAGGTLSVRVTGNLNNYAAQATPFTPTHAALDGPDAVDVARPTQPDAVTTEGVDRPDDVNPDQAARPGSVHLERPTRPDAPAAGPAPLYLPESPMFQANADPGHPYKVETNPALTSMASFYGSEYFLQRMDVDVKELQHRLLGDAFYETRLVQNQLLAETGRRFLNGYTNDADQMRALMNNAADLGQSLSLTVGVELTAAQAAALTKDIVWLVEEEYEGETVLAPKLYLAQASRENLLDGGATLAGRDVYLASDSGLINSGDIRGETVRAVAQNILNQGGRISATNLDLSALNDLINQGGFISGDAVTLTAGRDLVSVSTTQSFANANTVGSHIASLAGLESTGNLSLAAGRDLTLQGSALAAGGNAELLAGRDLTLDTVVTGFDMAVQSGKNSAREHLLHNTASSLDVDGSLTLASARDAVVAGAEISAKGDATLNAGGNLTVSAVTDEYSQYAHGSLKSGGLFGGSSSATVSTSRDTVRGAAVSAGGNLTVTAGSAGEPGAGNLAVLGSTLAAQGDAVLAAAGDVLLAAAGESAFSSTASTDKGFLSAKASVQEHGETVSVGSAVSGHNVTINGGDNVLISGSTVTAENDLLVAAKGDVVVSATQDTSSSRSESMHSQWGLLGVSSGMFEFYAKTTEKDAAQNAANVGGVLSAGHNLKLDAERDVTVIGSAVAAGNDLGLFAGRDVNLLPGQEYAARSHSTKKESIGISADLSSSGASLFAGYMSVEQGVDHRGDYTAGSLASAGSDAIIDAGRDVNQVGSHIEAGRDVEVSAGQDWNMTASYDTESLSQYIQQTQAGISASVHSGLTDAAKTVAKLPQEAASGKGGAGYSALTAAGAGFKAVDAVNGGLSEMVSASISIGASASRSDYSASSSTARPSTVAAGRDVLADAGRDIAIEGGQIMAGRDAVLDAGHDLTITSALNNSSASSSSGSAGGGIGLKASYGANGPAAGLNVNAGASGANSSGNGSSHTDSVILAGDALSTSSGRDTAVAGAHLEADSVWMDVGRNLTVASLQDHSERKNSSWSVGGSVTVGPGTTASLSVGGGKGSGASDWTGEQTGIIGHEEVDIRVEGNTHIKGAVIGAENGNLTLDTGTLSYETVQDRDHGSQTGIGVGMGLGDAKESGFTPKPDSLEASYASHDKEGVLFPTVGEGSITVRDDPDADLSGLNRDLGHTRDITRNDEVSMDFYVSKQAVETLGKAAKMFSELFPEANIADDWKDTPEGTEHSPSEGMGEEKNQTNPQIAKEMADRIIKEGSEALHISPEDMQSIVDAVGDVGAVKVLCLTAQVQKYGSLDAMPQDELYYLVAMMEGFIPSAQCLNFVAAMGGAAASGFSAAAIAEGQKPGTFTPAQVKKLEQLLLTQVFLTAGGRAVLEWQIIKGVWEKATGTTPPPEWKDNLLEHIPPVLPPTETPPYSGGSFTHSDVESYPSEDDPFGTDVLPHPSLPDGEDTGIPELTPPDVDIPPVLEARTLQTGGHTIKPSTAKALNDDFGATLSPDEWKKALEDLKEDVYGSYREKSKDKHGKIMSNGDILDDQNTYIGSLYDYVMKTRIR